MKIGSIYEDQAGCVGIIERGDSNGRLWNNWIEFTQPAGIPNNHALFNERRWTLIVPGENFASYEEAYTHYQVLAKLKRRTS